MSTSSKTGSILSYLSQHPNAGNKEVSEALAKKGIEVSPAYVGTIKYNASKQNGNSNGSGKAKTAKAKAPVAVKSKPVARPARRTPVLTTALTADQLVEAKQVVANLGGIENVRTALETARQFINGLGSVDAAEAALATLEKLENVVPQPPTDGGGTDNAPAESESASTASASPAAEVQATGIKKKGSGSNAPAGEAA